MFKLEVEVAKKDKLDVLGARTGKPPEMRVILVPLFTVLNREPFIKVVDVLFTLLFGSGRSMDLRRPRQQYILR